MDFDSHTKSLLRTIISAMNKAVSDDYSDFVQEYSSLDTHCGFGHMKGNFINTRVKEYLAQTDAFIHGFKRFTWQGRIIVDKMEKRTFSLSTHANLNSLFNKKGRRTPHFLQSILAIENKKCYNNHEQITLIDTSPFDRKTLENDYCSIMTSNSDEFRNFTHYVIAYSVSHNGLEDVDLILFDSRFTELNRVSLNEFIVPNYGKLTETPVTKPSSTTKSARNLVSVKKGLRLNLAEMEKGE